MCTRTAATSSYQPAIGITLRARGSATEVFLAAKSIWSFVHRPNNKRRQEEGAHTHTHTHTPTSITRGSGCSLDKPYSSSLTIHRWAGTIVSVDARANSDDNMSPYFTNSFSSSYYESKAREIAGRGEEFTYAFFCLSPLPTEFGFHKHF